jgi:hypothetical protein
MERFALEQIWAGPDDWFHDMQTLEQDLHEALEKLNHGVVLQIRGNLL